MLNLKRTKRCGSVSFTKSVILTAVLALSLVRLSAAAGFGSTIVGITVSQPTPDAAQVQFDFDPIAPRYAISGDGTNRVSLVLTSTTRRTTPNMSQFAGPLLQRVDLVEANGNVTLTFNGARPLNVHVTPALRTLSLILTAVPQNRPELQHAAGSETPRGTEVSMIRLRYADVNEVAALLGATNLSDQPFTAPPMAQQQTIGYQSTSGPLIPPLSGSPGATMQSALKLSEAVAIDRRLNAVILTGPTSQTESLKRLIELVDAPVPAVFLEASIVELTESAAKNLGIDFSSSGQIASFQLNVKSGQLAAGAVDLQAAIYGQVQRGNGRIIARPKVYAQSGTPASITTGDALPILTNISYPGSGTNIVQQQVQYVNVGVNLQILATVDPTKVVHSKILATVSSVTGYVQGVPQISQRQATSRPTSTTAKPS